MKKYLLLTIMLTTGLQAWATSTLEKNIVECTISTNTVFEEIILKHVQTQDADDYVYEDYVLDFTSGDILGESVDILGSHEQVRKRIFTSATAGADGVIASGSSDYVMIAQFDHSELIIKLVYEGRDQDNFATYSMYFEGEGPAYELVVSRVQSILGDSEHYGEFDSPLCVSHFDLDEFVTQ